MPCPRVSDLIERLCEIKVVKFGSFTLGNGLKSPIYFDLRQIFAYPAILMEVSSLLKAKITEVGSTPSLICGVPYAALPIATVISVESKIPMVMHRRESKGYGTAKRVEGKFSEGQNCVIIEDVIVAGTSIYETAINLKKAGLKVTHAFAFLNREQGGINNLKEKNIKAHCVITLTDVMETMIKRNCITEDILKSTMDFIVHNYVPIPKYLDYELCTNSKLTFTQRSEFTDNQLTKKILLLMDNKKTNLCVSADVNYMDDLIIIAKNVGPSICMLRIRTDLISDFSSLKMQEVRELANEFDFFIVEDSSLSHIQCQAMSYVVSNVHERNMSPGQFRCMMEDHFTFIYQLLMHACASLSSSSTFDELTEKKCDVSRWTDIEAVRNSEGEKSLNDFKENHSNKARGIILVSEICPRCASYNEFTCSKMVDTGLKNSDYVVGFIAPRRLTQRPDLLCLISGVSINMKKETVNGNLDNGGAEYRSELCTPMVAVKDKGGDILIVGREIINSECMAATAEFYRKSAFFAYQEFVNSTKII